MTAQKGVARLHGISVPSRSVREEMPEAMEVEDDTVTANGGAESSRFRPLEKNLQEDLAEGGEEFLADQEERERAKALIDALPLHK